MKETWSDFEKELNIDKEDEEAIRIEVELMRAVIKTREEKGLSQKELAEMCGMKQPTLAKLEKGKHSPQVNSLLKILLPMGYTLKIVPKRK